MRKWPTQVITVVVNVGRELSLLKMAINMANAGYPSFFLWNELEPRCQQRAAGSLELGVDQPDLWGESTGACTAKLVLATTSHPLLKIPKELHRPKAGSEIYATITQHLIAGSPKRTFRFKELLQNFLIYDVNLEVREYHKISKRCRYFVSNLRYDHTISENAGRCFGNECVFLQYCLWSVVTASDDRLSS